MKGLTLIEVTIASAILIVVFIVIYGVFGTSDTSYRNESSLRTAQLNAQRTVDEMVVEATESARGKTWIGAITIAPANPAGLTNALVYPSARSSSGAYVLNGLNPSWQSTILIVPIPAGDGTYALMRYQFPAPDANQIDCTSVSVAVDSTNVTVRFNDNSGIAIGVTPFVPRTSGRSLLKSDLKEFQLQTMAAAGTDDGNKTTQGNIQIGVQVQVRPPKGDPFQTGYVTTLRGRN